MKLEICANCYQSAKNAQDAGAHRIELCSELSIGGITPSYGLLKKVTEELTIETYVLIRPRSGNFTYTNAEFEIMKANIELCKDLGVSGIVSGVLNADNSIDLKRTKALIDLSKPMQFTFHRAFDCVPNPKETLEQLIDIGADRILTSGQELSAKKGLKQLQKLKKQAKDRIIILPGSGINSENAKLFKQSGFKEIHASASKNIEQKNDSIYFGNTTQTVSNVDTIKAILKNISDAD